MGGRGLWHRHTARARQTARGGDLARVSNFGLCEGVKRGENERPCLDLKEAAFAFSFFLLYV